MKSNDYLPAVKAQYEELPYPDRNPADETKRLLHCYGGNLFVINHYCFNGRKDFRSGFRCLIAGGGTGDTAIFMAEQLRHFDAEIVYLDFSSASRKIAEARAKIRGLTNITWITDSIMELPNLGLGEFDYINCTGVLHHLESTEAGLAALVKVLKPDGGINLMLYGKYGRQSVYDMQALMREYLPPDVGIREKIALARQLLDVLPETNGFQRNRDLWRSEIADDAGLFDLLLHSQDRCFTVREIYDLADSAGLHVIGVGGPDERLYDPLYALKGSSQIERLSEMDLRNRRAIGEILNGNISRHDFFLGRDANSVASLDDQGNAFIAVGSMYGKAPIIAASMADGRKMKYEDGSHLAMEIESDPVAKIVFTEMNGRTSLRKLYQRIQQEIPAMSGEQIRHAVRKLYDMLHSYGYLYLLAEGSHGIRIPDFDRLLAETTPTSSLPAGKIPGFLLKKPGAA